MVQSMENAMPMGYDAQDYTRKESLFEVWTDGCGMTINLVTGGTRKMGIIDRTEHDRSMKVFFSLSSAV